MTQKQILEGSIEKPGVAAKQPPLAKLTLERILCPVDFSEFSRRALRYAVNLARHFEAQLYIQHTAQPPAYLSVEGAEPAATQEYVRSETARARREIFELLSSAGLKRSEVTLVLNDGYASERILETVSQARIDLLVMGTHGHKGFNRLVLGSVTERMIHEAVCPVLVVCRPERDFVQPGAWDPVQLNTILLATDFSSSSDRALTYALRWASEWGGRVVLFHAVEPVPSAMKGFVDLFPEYNPYFEKQIAAAWETIRALVPEAARAGCETVCEVRHGNPKEEILKVAEEKNADLIVTGARGAGGSSALWGSVSSAVVRDGRYPVLVVRGLST